MVTVLDIQAMGEGAERWRSRGCGRGHCRILLRLTLITPPLPSPAA
jgi:hypothetical protein